MFYPTLQEVRQMAGRHNLIPVAKSMLADTETPIRIFHRLHDREYAFLLESVEGGVKWARYSFIGTDPFVTIRGKNGRLYIRERGRTEMIVEDGTDPVAALKRLTSRYSSPDILDLPRFTGGAVGFFGYDLLQYYEELPAHRNDDLQMDDIRFMFCDQIVAFDHVKQHIQVIANVHVPEGADDDEVEQAYREACAKIERMIEQLQKPQHVPPVQPATVCGDDVLDRVKSNVDKGTFLANVEAAKRYIDSGEVLQVVLSQRFEMETEATPLHVYRILRTLNPSPYMYYLKLDEEVIVGASPELLVRVEGERVQTRPIAGTRPRGKTEAEDEALARELLADEKELAEHRMLVDLGRNDLEKVSEHGTVQCDSFMEIERYSHVMHIVTNVSGRLRKDKDFFDALLSCMPAGTVSGAPKLRAMEIIAELENEARGAYAGAIGYLGFSGNMDTCITIRTIIFRGGKAYVQAGAGIVHDSVPEKEYEETQNKAKAMLMAIQLAERMFHADRQPVATADQER